MATMKDAAATGALNEEDYINKLYDQMQDQQKKLLVDAFSENTGALDTAKQEVQNQTDTHLQRTDVEAQKTRQGYKPANVSSSIDQQASLAMGNQQRKNVSTLQDARAEADAEIERRRQLLGQQYAKAIEQARADNDMLRAEQLYREAQERDAQIRALQTEAGQLLAAKGDNSMLNSLLEGGISGTGNAKETWSDVLKHEDSIGRIYDSANESARLQAEATTDAILSQIRAEQEQQKKESDRKLTETYVNSLRQGKNYDEVQGAYGMGSGNKAQARLARQLGTTEDMTALRGLQTGADAAALQQIATAIQGRNATITDAVSDNELKRIQALYDAAKNEERALLDTQRTVGKTLAEQGDFSVLGKLYGLTQDQIDKLQGTGAYAPKEEPKKETSSGSNTGSTGETGGTKPEKDENDVPVEEEEKTDKVSRGQQSILDLGHGPISNETLADMVEQGRILEVPTASGSIYIEQTGNPALDRQAIIEAANEAAKKNDTEAIEAFKNMNVVFADAGANAKKETVIDKIYNAVADTKIGSTIINDTANHIETTLQQIKERDDAIAELTKMAANQTESQENKSSGNIIDKIADAIKGFKDSQPSQLEQTQAAIEELKRIAEENNKKQSMSNSSANASPKNTSAKTSGAKKTQVKKQTNQMYLRD